jgi:gamma-glutamyltranspeptidase/glutathione hydrolase
MSLIKWTRIVDSWLAMTLHRRLAVVLVSASLAVGCGDDDDIYVGPGLDAGADASLDAGPALPDDGGTDAALDAGPALPTPGVSALERGFAKGVVAVSDPLASKAGAEILAQGGNAIDAASAIQFALNVVEPQSSGIGGGGFMLVYVASEKKTYFIDGREKAPAAATPGMFGTLDFANASTSGISVGVPGTVAAITTALGRWGSLPLATTMARSITLAEEGFAVSPLLASDIVNTSDRGFVMSNLQPEAAALFQPGGVPLKAGAIFKQPDLAKTLKLIAAGGADAFYKGPVAAAIVAAQLRSTTNGAAGDKLTAGRPGAMTLADLEAYKPAVREPIAGSYRGYTVLTMPPPSGGGVTVLQQLAMLEQFPLGDSSLGFGFGAQKTLNVMVDAQRLSFSDRNFWIGDADFVPVPVGGLLDKSYLAGRGALLKPDSALTAAAIRPGMPPASLSLPLIQPREGNHTTHYVVIDAAGNIVSYTTTVESLFGAGIVVPGFGFILNNELTDFNFPPTFNMATGDLGANDVAPNKRPRSSMAPTLLLKAGQPFATVGSAGGSRIINAIVQTIVNMVDHKMGVQQAIDAPRISAGASGSVFCETGPFMPNVFTPQPAFSPAVIAGLDMLREPSIGVPPCAGNEANGANLSAQAAVVDLATGLKYGGADKRRGGTVEGVDCATTEARSPRVRALRSHRPCKTACENGVLRGQFGDLCWPAFQECLAELSACEPQNLGYCALATAHRTISREGCSLPTGGIRHQ